MRKTYTVVLTPNSAGGWLVDVPALPGCLTEGPTLTGALLMAEDAVRGYLEVLQEDGQAAPREGAGVLVRLGRNREAIVRKISVTLPRGAAKVA
jgi:antitoxin HicB